VEIIDIRKTVAPSLVGCVVGLGLAACTSGAGMQATPQSVVPPGPQSSTTVASSDQTKASTRTDESYSGKKGSVPTLAARADVTQHPVKGKTWFAKDAKDMPRLLFISDYAGEAVYIYSMPEQKLVGTITGFSSPEGMCEDNSGNIWIANASAQEMLQYSRTGTLLRTLSIANAYPASCAVNRKTGDLAVSNIESTSGPGNIMIFKNASGGGTEYTNSDIYEYFFVGYDDSGNLFFDGTDSTRSTSYFAELPSGSGTTKTISLSNGTLHFAGLVQWYKIGKYIALGDQMCGGTTSACIYWVTVSGSTATISGTTNLTNYKGGQVCDLTQGVLAADREKYVAGADYETCGYTTNTTDRWAYEAGGQPTNDDNTVTFLEPIGAAISAK
jgi:hypothetical protein